MKKALIIFFIFASISSFAQFSKTHYIPPLTAQNDFAEDQYIYISTPSTNNVSFKIIEIGGRIITGNVNNGSPYIHFIGNLDTSQLFTPKMNIGKITNKGYIIESNNLIYVSVRVNAVANGNGEYNHAGGLVSKGNSALGKIFRLGAMLNPLYDTTLLNFASILSTENGTKLTISNIPIGTKLSDGTVISGPIVVTLNKNESYVLALENYNDNSIISNSSRIIGALVESDKPVVVNSGSFGGTNSIKNGRDIGFDQIVPVDKTGTKYIFIKGKGTDELERILLVANEDNTQILLNGTTLFKTINKGEYADIDGSKFTNENLYLTTSNKVFAYQCIGGTGSAANQNLFFVPPLNCATPNVVDNIPFIEKIGNIEFTNGNLNIVTETGASVLVNNAPPTVSPIAITGNPSFVCYTIPNLTGNISVKSTKQVYVSFFSTNGAATYGGYYSGFDLKPEIISDIKVGASSNCIPNVILKISDLTAYDSFQWYENDVIIPLATNNTYTPTRPGFYQVKGSISGCLSDVFSDKIPVSSCPTNLDNDLANDNIDIDNDNDGITNCTESYGHQNINISSSVAGNITVGNYSNSFTGIVSTSITASAIPFKGNADGSFVSEVPAGKGNSVTYQLNFPQPISVGIEYVPTANPTDLLNSEAEYVVNSDINKTITVLNPDDQLSIDTNYDGIYETGVTQFSSFEIRFRLNSAAALAAGTGTFKFLTYLTNSISFTHKNLSDDNPNKSTLKFFAACIPKDSDGDGIPDQLDLDSDNDGILDIIESQGKNFVLVSGIDFNNDGLDDAYGTGINPADSDADGVLDYLDLDSDNDGIYDLVESGSGAIDANKNGLADGNTFGTNGLANSLETSSDSGVLNYTVADTDNDGIKNYIELDSDNDLCNDVIEAGFIDNNGDGMLGNNPIIVDTNGIVTSATGYTIPNVNYTIASPITIMTQPNVAPTCELQKVAITLVDNGGNTYQWQISTGGSWTDIVDNTTYSGTTTNTLSIATVSNAMSGNKYRVKLNKTGNSCGLISAETALVIYALPVVNDIKIVQCDDNLDAITSFNLTVKNEVISSNSAKETFTYYTSLAGANTSNPSELIADPLAFVNTTPATMPVWARAVNKNGCFRVSKITLQVLATNIPNTFNKAFKECDDFLDINGANNANNNKRDGISYFNFSSVTNDIKTMLPIGNYTITYYRNQADALAELNTITDISNYRNIGYPNAQQIWGRVDSDVDNACFGLGPFVTLTVDALPYANPVAIQRECDDNQDGIFTFNTSSIESTLKNGQANVNFTYFDATNNPLKDSNGVLITSQFPNTFSTKSQTIKAVVSNNWGKKCSEETIITFIVDKLPIATLPFTDIRIKCDDELDPLSQNGIVVFDTSNIENEVKGTQTNVAISYFDNQGNPLLDNQGNPIISSFPSTFETTSRTIKAAIRSTIIGSTCPAISVDIPFLVNSLPNINLNKNGGEDEFVCSNLPDFFVKLNAGIQDGSPTSIYTYIWSKDGIVLSSETSPTLDVNTEGIYTVEVTTLFGCPRIRTIKVTASNVAQIDSNSIVVDDLKDVNTVTVNVIKTGVGDYEYSLDEPYGPYQDSNFFDNVPAGIHEVFINDKNKCGSVSQIIAVVGVPKYFTPNNDGYNDYWNVKGVNENFNANSIIYIFDRYGKLLKQLSPSSKGWDGTFVGNPLPSDDYWYTVKLEDGREAKGHFSLKR